MMEKTDDKAALAAAAIKKREALGLVPRGQGRGAEEGHEKCPVRHTQGDPEFNNMYEAPKWPLYGCLVVNLSGPAGAEPIRRQTTCAWRELRNRGRGADGGLVRLVKSLVEWELVEVCNETLSWQTDRGCFTRKSLALR